jgi:hypothetical protein
MLLVFLGKVQHSHSTFTIFGQASYLTFNIQHSTFNRFSNFLALPLYRYYGKFVRNTSSRVSLSWTNT